MGETRRVNRRPVRRALLALLALVAVGITVPTGTVEAQGEPPGSIHGEVVSTQDPIGVAGVQVDAFAVGDTDADPTATAVTDDSGNISFHNLPPGDYALRFTPPAASALRPNNGRAPGSRGPTPTSPRPDRPRHP